MKTHAGCLQPGGPAGTPTTPSKLRPGPESCHCSAQRTSPPSQAAHGGPVGLPREGTARAKGPAQDFRDSEADITFAIETTEGFKSGLLGL